MLTEVCAEIRNYFVHSSGDIHSGTYTVANGHIEPLSFLQEGQYFRVTGSVFCDGVYQYGVDTLPNDETFTGAIWAMYVPKAFVDLCEEIADWVSASADVLKSPYQSESFGGYTYSKGQTPSGGGYTWQLHFASRLNVYRRVRV